MLCRVWRSAADRPGRGEREGGREGEGRGREREADGNGAQQSVSQGFMCEIINKRQHRGASTRSTNQSQHSHRTHSAVTEGEAGTALGCKHQSAPDRQPMNMGAT